MERSLAVLGAVNPVGEIPASQHRDRPLDHAHVHVLENASQRPAIAAAKIRKDRDGRARRIPPDDRAILRQARERKRSRLGGTCRPLEPCRCCPPMLARPLLPAGGPRLCPPGGPAPPS